MIFCSSEISIFSQPALENFFLSPPLNCNFSPPLELGEGPPPLQPKKYVPQFLGTGTEVFSFNQRAAFSRADFACCVTQNGWRRKKMNNTLCFFVFSFFFLARLAAGWEFFFCVSARSLLYGLREVFSGCLFSLPNLFCFRVALSAHLVRNIDFSLSLFSCLRSERMTERGFRMPEMFTLMPFLPALARPSFNASSSSPSSSSSSDFFGFVHFLKLCDSLGYWRMI